ncbi:MAG: fibronectin type III domain-containing protein [Candidatus Manganitrophaceae bacterium]|nr:MAG: fibronectin type III domain-containing protein [Candidatus Manganitrophaceae bacterium]
MAGYKVYYGTVSRHYGAPITVGNQTAYTVTGLGLGTYYFALTAYDAAGNESAFSNEISKTFFDTSAPVSGNTPPEDAQPSDMTPPADVQHFSAVPGDREITLQWINPPDVDFAGVLIRYRTDRYPSGLNDGELLGDFKGEPNQNMTTVQSGLENQVTYYYSASSYDSHGNYQSTAHASASPFSTGGNGPDQPTAGGGGCAMRFPQKENLPGPAQAAEIPLLLGVLLFMLLKRRFRWSSTGCCIRFR